LPGRMDRGRSRHPPALLSSLSRSSGRRPHRGVGARPGGFSSCQATYRTNRPSCHGISSNQGACRIVEQHVMGDSSFKRPGDVGTDPEQASRAARHVGPLDSGDLGHAGGAGNWAARDEWSIVLPGRLLSRRGWHPWPQLHRRLDPLVSMKPIRQMHPELQVPWADRSPGDQAGWRTEPPRIQGVDRGASGLGGPVPRSRGHAVPWGPIEQLDLVILVEEAP
jgi:hypothetical protein